MRKTMSIWILLTFFILLNGCANNNAAGHSLSYNLNEAPNRTTYDFESYDELYQSLNNKQSELRKESRKTDYGTNYNNFLTVVEDKGATIKVPTYDNVPMVIEGNAEWQRITLLTEELYGLPWIWFYCKYQDNTLVVGTTYCDLLGISEVDKAWRFEGILNTAIPNAPSPNNFEKYITSYDSIYEQELVLSGNQMVSAVVFDSATSARVHYRYVYEDIIVTMWLYEGGEIADDFWAHFSLREYR